MNAETIISQTKKWVTDVVVTCNFCPFAGRAVKKGSIVYIVIENAGTKVALEALAKIFIQMDEDPSIETVLLILPASFEGFTGYLNLVELGESLLEKEGYEGIYQLASFHPSYLFEGSSESDPANYTNRSPYPMLHILREASVTEAIDSHPDIDSIPGKNIAFANAKGLEHMKQLLQACMTGFK